MDKLVNSILMMLWSFSVMPQPFSSFTGVVNSLSLRTPHTLATSTLLHHTHGHQRSDTRHGDHNLPTVSGPSGDVKHWSEVIGHPESLDMSRHCTLNGDFADCSSLGLWTVPTNLPGNIRRLDLLNNSLVLLPNYSFAQYPMLLSLNLSFNMINSLQTHTFYNLSSLEKLDLFKNKLLLRPSSYPQDVFCPLKSLTYLDISRNNQRFTSPHLQYPDVAISCLRNLESLTIDGLPMKNNSHTFGDGFRKLTKLSSLIMKGSFKKYCLLDGVYNHSFKNVENLESLALQACNLDGRHMESGAFRYLKKLRKLDISKNKRIGTDHWPTIFNDLYHLENLTELRIGSVVNHYAVSQCLDMSTVQQFPQQLTFLDVTNNNLEAVDEGVIARLSPNLTTLDLSGNRFTVGSYLRSLSRMKNLISLFLNGFNRDYGFPVVYPHMSGPLKPAGRNCTTFLYKYQEFTLTLPPKLESVEMNNAGLDYTWTKLIINSTNVLTNLSIHGNKFHTLEGPILGLHSLKYLDVSYCVIQYISPTFFNTLISLEVLRLDNNFLGPFLSKAENEDVFSALTNVKVLNLTANGMVSVPRGLFKRLSNLTSLYLKRNSFAYFDTNLTAVVALSVLDLSETHVKTLPQQIQRYFDNLVNRVGVNVSIHLEETPISCNCPNFQFLQWLTTSNAFSKPFHHYYCDSVYTGQPPIEDDYDSILAVLKNQCTSHALLFFIIGSATAVVGCIIIGVIVYRFRWNIRYLYYAVYLRFKKNWNEPGTHTHEYDVFICYASEDARFAEHTADKELSRRGLRIFLHGRDFKAGDYVSSNIVNAVCSCKKTVVLLTRALLASHWCNYEIEMAKIEGIHSGRPVLIFVFLEEIPVNMLSRNLSYNIKNNTYMEYTSASLDPDQMRRWWDKLANDIKD